MAEWKGHFDDQVFQAFVKSVGIYPVGALVRLESGRLGVIMEQHKSSLLTPMVKVFFSTRTKMPIAQELVDLSKLAGRDKIVGRESASDWGFKNIEELWSGLPPARGRISIKHRRQSRREDQRDNRLLCLPYLTKDHGYVFSRLRD